MVTIYASARPEAPPTVVTSIAATDLVVTWQDSPEAHGAAVTEFIITFREADNLNFSEIVDHCNPDLNSADFIAKSCSVPMAILM